MIEYLTGGIVIWIVSGLLALYTVCRPISDGGEWDRPDFIVCGLVVLFGPLSQVVVINTINKVHLKYIEKGRKK